MAVEEHREIPFRIRRMYYVFNTPDGARRGAHAHRRTRQLAICVCGSCKFLLDDGQRRAEVVLDSNTRGLLIDAMVWHEMFDFSPDCVMVVLADTRHDEGDYIRSYQEFLEGVR